MKTSSIKKILFFFLSCVTTITLFSQENPRLIVRSDDMGAFHSVNVACIDAYKNGIQTVVEVMPVTAWFPEAVRMLNENPGIDVGIHLAITSEWENIKWRPLTPCPSLTDENGYFYPMMGSHQAYPGQSIQENKWDIDEIEQEFRAQIELTLKNIPQASHLSGHMGALRFDPKVVGLVHKLAEEYNLTFVEGDGVREKYNVTSVWYDGSNATDKKEESFLSMLNKLERGKNYIFLDHPALNNDEMETVGHIGYEGVAEDRQGVTDLLTSEKVKQTIKEKGIELITYNDLTKSLPRSTPEAEKISSKGISDYLAAVKKSGQDLHSIMIVRHGKVVAAHWLGDHTAHKPHIMNSVSKTFAATAIGFAVSEGKLNVTDKVISFFPDKLPSNVSQHLKELEIKHLLTMSVGHDPNAVREKTRSNNDWVGTFLAEPIPEKPGTQFNYNSLATYMLSAIIQKVTGEKLIDYLYPRLFRPLGIVGARWEECPQGINIGGWGLYIKTEDMAKLGQFFLQKGEWNGVQLLSESWIDEATTSHIASLPAGAKKEDLKIKPKDSDWLQGYGYQMWRCRNNGYRADGANGQFIIVLPEKDTVIVTTAHIGDMQAELNLIWKYLLPAIK
ncbi:ChbG/HpnK family deacetylase [Proteiniphilum sp.]|uniref:ChbG/HpnK family deacetylase n=1 Tax=Proteiniphilum sp. TaxID=1926877 RepID=UPI002B21AE9D|nr:ChbG/HpnK family deacetylase [Proteiniphilum sp.]MEA4918645.1 ChbG/HpnK family deacetylase [Proteiniphilum sp.]